MDCIRKHNETVSGPIQTIFFPEILLSLSWPFEVISHLVHLPFWNPFATMHMRLHVFHFAITCRHSCRCFYNRIFINLFRGKCFVSFILDCSDCDVAVCSKDTLDMHQAATAVALESAGVSGNNSALTAVAPLSDVSAFLTDSSIIMSYDRLVFRPVAYWNVPFV